MKEPLLEPILRRLRVHQVLPTIRMNPNGVLLDVGCGRDCLLLKTAEPYVQKAIGIDFKVGDSDSGRIRTIRMTMTDSLPFASGTFDIITMLAVLEHLPDPLGTLKETERILKPGGMVVLTVPGKRARPVLLFLCHRLKLISEREMRDHRQYFDRADLEALFARTGMAIERHRYFELGMNNFCVARRRQPGERTP
jgi:2-polyprenyl-3-methyl-5-hydroxy-6-metoxy-1,4-benzoquinol methylase